MGKIGAILGAIHKFTPKGQAIALKTLKEKEKILNEIEKRNINIQNMEIKKEKYIKIKFGKIK